MSKKKKFPDIEDIPAWPTVVREGGEYVRCPPPPPGSISFSSPRIADKKFGNMVWTVFEVDGNLWKRSSLI